MAKKSWRGVARVECEPFEGVSLQVVDLSSRKQGEDNFENVAQNTLKEVISREEGDSAVQTQSITADI